jgi:hypothetical protein
LASYGGEKTIDLRLRIVHSSEDDSNFCPRAWITPIDILNRSGQQSAERIEPLNQRDELPMFVR